MPHGLYPRMSESLRDGMRGEDGESSNEEALSVNEEERLGG